jgi:hypothetical protein
LSVAAPVKVGLLVGREWSWPPQFMEAVNTRSSGVVAEYAKLGGTRDGESVPYAVIIDRISHEVPYYRSYLKHAVLQGVTVVNNPFMWTADDRFFEAGLAARLGVAHPKTVVLPNKDYGPGVVPTESLRNLIYPLDWDGIVEHVGLPCALKDAHRGGVRLVCQTKEELLHCYNQSGLATTVVQEIVEPEQSVRCLCLGREEVLPMPYDPREERYIVHHNYLSADVGRRVVEDSLKLVRALGYDMDVVEWAVRDGVPYAVDFLNPAPDLDVYSLTPHYFEWAVERTADLAIRLAKHPRPQLTEMRWSKLFQS